MRLDAAFWWKHLPAAKWFRLCDYWHHGGKKKWQRKGKGRKGRKRSKGMMLILIIICIKTICSDGER